MMEVISREEVLRFLKEIYKEEFITEDMIIEVMSGSFQPNINKYRRILN